MINMEIASDDNQNQVVIKRSLLLALFTIVPLLLVIGMSDYYYFDASLLHYMGLTSLFLPVYLLFFELPHILASYLGFIDREYVVHYSRHLFIWLPLILLSFLGLLWVNLNLAVVIYLIFTIYHVIKQQTGIALLFGVRKNLTYQLWTWLAILITTLNFLMIVGPAYISKVTLASFTNLIYGLIFLGTITSVVLIYQSSTTMSRLYIMATWLMLAASYLLLGIGYVFFAFFVIRFIHDVTAFIFYITHEINRNRATIKNYLYRILPMVPMSLVVFVPVFAVGLGLTMRGVVTDVQALFIINMMLGFMHYYLESVMWKRNSPHRQYVKVV